MKVTRMDLGAACVFAGQFAAAGYVAAFGSTAPVPMHFALNGEANRWGDRTELATVMTALTVLMAFVYWAVRRRDDDRAAAAPSSRQPSNDGAMLVLILSAVICAFMSATGVGAASSLATAAGGAWFHMSLLAILMLVIGVFLGKVTPNPWLGVRTWWSANSRLAWDKSNRLAGRIYFWAGLVLLLAAPIAPQPAGFQAAIAAMVAGAAIAVFESWRVWRLDPDRRQTSG